MYDNLFSVFLNVTSSQCQIKVLKQTQVSDVEYSEYIAIVRGINMSSIQTISVVCSYTTHMSISKMSACTGGVPVAPEAEPVIY